MRFLTLFSLFLALSGLGYSANHFVPDNFATIQGAITAASGGDTVYVRAGTYYENIDFLGKAITVRNYNDTSITVIDGSQAGSVVIFQNGEGSNSVLQGFTITNGSGTFESTWAYYGGGVYCKNASSPTIQYNVIVNNTADYGAGIDCHYDSSPRIRGNTITENTSLGNGGGIACYNGSSPLVEDCTLTKNSAVSFGGGVHAYDYADPKITNSIFLENVANYGGGFRSSNCYNIKISSCTFSKNKANTAGGAIRLNNGTLFVEDSILWDDTPQEISSFGALSVTYSDVMGGWTGTGNLMVNPAFFSGPDGNYYLCQVAAGQGMNSPCLDAGNPATPMVTGTTRTDKVQDTWLVDMGYHYPIYPPNTIYVPDLYKTIQSAIDAAFHGMTIIVKAGTYVENIDFKGKGVTVRSEQGPQVTVIDGNQSGHVVTFNSGEESDSVLDGFTVINGMAGNGGGIYCKNSSSPIITNNIIKENSATASYGGGGIYCGWSSPTITHNTITQNSASVSGGGLRLEYCEPLIAHNEISDNTANDGAAVCGDNFDGTLDCNLILGNTSTHYTGGIHCWYSDPVITNNVIAANTAAGWAGAIYCRSSNPYIANNTVTRNSAASKGGCLVCYLSTPTVFNNIFWDNSAPTGPEIYLAGSSTLTVSHSDVMGGSAQAYVESGSTLNWGSGMIDEDPLFVNAANSDYHLTGLSPCVNRGTKGGAPSEDVDGDSRPFMGGVEMGADEFMGTHTLAANTFSVSETTGGVVNFSLNAGAGNANRTYLVLGSLTGTAPGTPLPGGLATLPLQWDIFTNITLQMANTAVFSGSMGALDAQGSGSFTFNTLGPLPKGLLGAVMYYAYALKNKWDFVSNPVPVEVTP